MNLLVLIVALILLLWTQQKYYWIHIPSTPFSSLPILLFNTSRAMNSLHNLLFENSSMQQHRLFGTQSEADTILFLKNKITHLQKEYESNLSKQQITMHFLDPSTPLGEHCLHLIKKTVLIQYKNLKNVIVWLQPTVVSTNQSSALLVNSHFDSGIYSPGAFDDGIPMVVSLEMIELILQSLQTKPLQRGIIFLFNNAEEMGLLGSHSFVTNQLKEFPPIDFFYNLEAGGSGGFTTILQASNPWIMQQYAKLAKYPKANVISQDIFQKELIPSDTDYRIFVREAKLQGVDNLFFENGYTYHTKLDHWNRVTSQSVENMGSNAWHMIYYFLFDFFGAIPQQNEQGSSVHFDVLGIWMLVLPIHQAQVLNISIFVLSLATIFMFYSSITLWKGLLQFIVPICLGALYSGSVLYCLFITKKYQAWYKLDAIYILILFGYPFCLGCYFGSFVCKRFFSKQNSSASHSVTDGFVALLLYWCSIGLLFHYLQLASTILFSLLCCSCMSSLVLYHSVSIRWKSVALILLVFPCLIIGSVALDMMESFIPILGRIPSVHSDLVVFSLSLLSLVASFGNLLPIVWHTQQQTNLDKKTGVVLFGALFFLLGYVLVGLPINPYSVSKPKRTILYNQIHFYAEQELQFKDAELVLKVGDSVDEKIVLKELSIPFQFDPQLYTFRVPSAIPAKPMIPGSYVHNNAQEILHATWLSRVTPQHWNVTKEEKRISFYLELPKEAFATVIRIGNPFPITNSSLQNLQRVQIKEEETGMVWYDFYVLEGFINLHKTVQWSIESEDLSLLQVHIASHYVAEDSQLFAQKPKTVQKIQQEMPSWVDLTTVVTTIVHYSNNANK